MALRRLLSGWLIAMAALARSVAQALERASEDRSAPAPDPVMAALAERYPGAPAHWLAHVAERTSQLAEAGEAPLSLTSDPSAWPPVGPDGLPSRPTTPTEPEPASRDPRPPPASRRETAVPTLAALNDRSSETWRRPEVERKRRPRPVFASLEAAPTSERPTRPEPTPEPGAAPRRPRSPLTVVGSPSQAAARAPEPAAPLSNRPKAPPSDPIWSEAPPARAATPDAAEARPDPRRAPERPLNDHAFVQAHPKAASEDRSKTHPDRINAAPARRQRSWFFARSARIERSLELSADPGRPARGGSADTTETIAPARAPVPQATFPASSSDVSAVKPDRTWLDKTPPPPRRSLFRTLAALGARRRANRFTTPDPTGVRMTPPIDQPSRDAVPERSAPSFISSRAIPSAPPAPVFSHLRGAPPSRTKADAVPRAARRILRGPPKAPLSDGETQVRDKRSSFATPPPVPPRAASRRLAASPSDDRWPALPPMTIAPPPGVEASPPRWDQLAREQEEGRWSV
ncbi:hypothetical protein ASD38_05540 [Caulobacter sp. Root487D2Y]|uniref:hypothetical protein n=1 Tax=Caulobacter sp. Root487D2Y TaxID=1736547 RepID=UPI0006FC2E08|nr:hypothetical protein [Caulobacter sp. Root487D2Y]KQY30831.1 hypothetical protein ASD38_05540 [Caulobacter sp. Root487D2Y]